MRQVRHESTVRRTTETPDSANTTTPGAAEYLARSAPEAESTNAARSRKRLRGKATLLDDPKHVLRDRVGTLAMQILGDGLAMQDQHGKPMAHGGGVYTRTATWARWLLKPREMTVDAWRSDANYSARKAAEKQVERAMRRLRDFGLMVGRWDRRIGRRGQMQTVYVRTFAPDAVCVGRNGRWSYWSVLIPGAARSRPGRGGARSGAGRPRGSETQFKRGERSAPLRPGFSDLRIKPNSNAGSGPPQSTGRPIVEALPSLTLDRPNSNAGTYTEALTEKPENHPDTKCLDALRAFRFSEISWLDCTGVGADCTCGEHRDSNRSDVGSALDPPKTERAARRALLEDAARDWADMQTRRTTT